MALAGDDAQARAVVARLIDRLGFDPVDAGDLGAARGFAIGTPVFGAGLQQDDMQAALSAPLAA
jgi:predicted dinucleotide-binding enzyme